jgi:hypothetical protein
LELAIYAVKSHHSNEQSHSLGTHAIFVISGVITEQGDLLASISPKPKLRVESVGHLMASQCPGSNARDEMVVSRPAQPYFFDPIEVNFAVQRSNQVRVACLR